MTRLPCNKCGTQILETTASANGGMCVPCRRGEGYCVVCGKLVSEPGASGEFIHLKCARTRSGLVNEDDIQLFDIRTNGEWHRAGAVAANCPAIKVDPAGVPEQFRHLIPYVERWAISCDPARSDYFDQQPQADIDEFYQAVLPHLDALNAWVDEYPRTDAKIDFLITLKAHCNATPPPSPEEIAAIRRQREEAYEAKRQYWREVARKSKSAPAPGAESGVLGDQAP